MGFVRGRAAPTVFYNKLTQVRVVVHGDDFTFCDLKEDLVVVQGWLRSGLKSKLGEFWAQEKMTTRNSNIGKKG